MTGGAWSPGEIVGVLAVLLTFPVGVSWFLLKQVDRTLKGVGRQLNTLNYRLGGLEQAIMLFAKELGVNTDGWRRRDD